MHAVTVSPPVIANLGTGAIGGLVMGRCLQEAIPVRVISRHGSGIEVNTTLLGPDLSRTPITGRVEPISLAQLREADVLVVAVKSYQVRPFFEALSPGLPKHLTLVLIHNGMGPQHWVRDRFPHNSIAVGTTSHGALKQSDNSVLQTGLGQTQLGYFQGEARPGINSALEQVLAPVSWHQNIDALLWRKLAINACINPITAIAQVPNGALTQPHYQRQIAALCEETSLVMDACGIASSPADLIIRVNEVIEQTANNLSSMNRDVFFRRPTEIDAITGFLLNHAQQQGIPVPEHQRLYAGVKDLEAP